MRKDNPRRMMNRQAKKPLRLSEVLENFITQTGLSRRFREQRVLDSWFRAVGEPIAEQTQPIRIQDRILQVLVSNSVWMQQLQYLKRALLDKLREHGAEDVDDVRFFIGEVGKNCKNEGCKGPENGPKEWENLTETEKNYIKKEVMSLADPEMRRVFESVFARGFAMQKSGKLKKGAGRR